MSTQIYCTSCCVNRSRSLLSIIVLRLILGHRIPRQVSIGARALSHEKSRGTELLQRAVHERVAASEQPRGLIFDSHSHGDVLRLPSSHTPLLLPQSSAVRPFDPAIIAAVSALCQGFIFPSSSFEFLLVPW